MTNQQESIKGKLEVRLTNAIKIVVDIENEKEIISTLSHLGKVKEQLVKFDKKFSQEQHPTTIPPSTVQTGVVLGEDSYEKISNMLDNVTADKLRSAKVFSIKDKNVQLLKPNQFKKVMDAICVLLFVLEVGVGKRDLQYDTFRDIFESQNIKSGSPLAMIMNNMKTSKYIEDKKYKAKVVSLSPKGQNQAITVLNNFLKT